MKVIRKWGPIIVCAAVTSEVVHIFISNDILAMFVSVGISSVLYFFAILLKEPVIWFKEELALRRRIKRAGDEHLKKHPHLQNLRRNK